MDQSHALARFSFLAEAFDGTGGFAPHVLWEYQTLTITDQAGNPLSTLRRVPKLAGPCHLVPHSREGAEKFAGRCALAVYENHLREACDRYISFLSRRRPMRTGLDAPLVQLLIEDANLRGSPLDQFLMAFALHAKARGSMLLLIDMPSEDAVAPVSLQDQIERRAVPYLRSITPDVVRSFVLDDETGLFTNIEISCTEEVDGKRQECMRYWDAKTWSVSFGDRVIKQGVHPFGQCPILSFTESGTLFPEVGRFAQIADLSRGIYNNASGLTEILRSQTFSVPVMQVTPEQSATFDPNRMAVILGTHNILTYPGERPDYISPDAAQAQVYMEVMAQQLESIRRVSMEAATADTRVPSAESGVARRLRFERLNADLAGFAGQMQALEKRIWTLFHRALGTTNRVQVEWPSDFNLIDTAVELDILTLMQATGMPEAVLNAKRSAIVAAEFDAADDGTKAELQAALDETAQQAAQDPAKNPAAKPAAAPPSPPQGP